MTPTTEQLNFYSACKTPSCLALYALAGTGKTYSLQNGADHLKGSGLSTSFSKATVTELGRKMPSRFPARTMHGLGLDALKRKWGKAKVDSRGDLLFTFLRDSLQNYDRDDKWLLLNDAKSLVEKAQIVGIHPNSDRFLTPDTPDQWENLCDLYDIPHSPMLYNLAHKALTHINEVAEKEHTVNFGQMLTLPLFTKTAVPQHKVIIIDEAQDLNPLQHALVKRLLRAGGQLIAAGDPNQAIFAFAGAMADSYSALISEFDCQKLPLTICWRCPTEGILEAQKYVPEIQPAPSAAQGEVIRHELLDVSDIPKTVICRNNAPLMSVALKLFLAGKSVEVAGRDIGAGLKSLTKRLASGKNSDKMTSPELVSRLEKWAEREIERKPKSAPRVNDKTTAIKHLASVHSTVGAIRKHLDNLYVNPEDGTRRPAEYHLSTIHKAKGREWPDVLLLDSHLIHIDHNDPQSQEKNIAYVGVTRAQNTLHFANSHDIQ